MLTDDDADTSCDLQLTTAPLDLDRQEIERCLLAVPDSNPQICFFFETPLDRRG